MSLPDARALGDAVRSLLTRHVAPSSRDRLFRYATRHVPLDSSDEGSPFIPPMYTLRIAAALDLPPTIGVALAASSCLYFAAADVFDDCADGDVRRATGLDVNDGCRLLFLHQVALAEGAPPARVPALVELYASCGLEMAEGQERDLLGTDAIEAFEPVEMCRRKTGGELAAVIAAPAVAAGIDPAPWRAFGQAFGALLQLLTDYFDLFLDPTSDDWEAGKPSLPIRVGLADRRHGAAVALMLAGDRGANDRKSRGLWHLVQAGAGKVFASARDRLRREMEAAEKAAGRPAVLAAIRGELEEWVGGVVDALDEYRADPAPPVAALADEVALCRRAALAFLATDPRFDEASEVQRHALFDRPLVVGDVFGQALVCESLRGEGVAVEPVLAQLLARVDPDGWRYYPGHFELPADGDCIGVVLQAVAGTRHAAHPAAAIGVAAVLHNLDGEGLPYTWLADGWAPPPHAPRHTRESIDAFWAGGVCPAAAANALLGLWRHDREAHRETVRRGLLAIAAKISGEAAPASEFYHPVAVDYMVAHALAEVGDGLRLGAPARQATAAIVTRLGALRRLSGRFGDPLTTALAGWTLARLGALDGPARQAVIRALVDAQAADGGYPADPFYRTIPHPVSTWYGSRVLTTAYVLQALRLLGGDRPG
ncbi:MAG: polyprenyl synthetase family protein [bacterium]|nr:polyprenyl synthetase family protein [Myxococcales bacterium]